jgi:ubiquitin C-terminal hydrolase
MRDFLSKLHQSNEIPFNLFEQQDSVEFLLPFLDFVRSEIPGITAFCDGILQTTIEAMNPRDNFKYVKTDVFVVIPLELHKSRSLTEYLKEFCKESEMTGDNQWTTTDGRMIDVKISNKIKDSSPILFFHLQRFTFDFNSGTKKKLNSIFDFPFELICHLIWFFQMD